MNARQRTNRIPPMRPAPLWAECLWPLTALGLLVAGGIGCMPHGAGMGMTGPIEPEEPMEAVIQRVNENNARVDFVLSGVGDAEGRYLRSDGKHEPFKLDAKLLFRRPRDLYLELEHGLGEDVMQIGSNQREFWVWKKVKDDVYWWGEHDQLDPHEYAELPIRPDQLVDVIGLGDLPTAPDPRTGPLFEVLPASYQLTFLESDAGQPIYPAKRVLIDRRPPYLVREVRYLTPTGREHTIAHLSNYRQVRGSAVLLPHYVRLEWPPRGEVMELDFSKMERNDSDRALRLFTSPRAARRDVGQEIRVDRKPAPAAAIDPTERELATTTDHR